MATMRVKLLVGVGGRLVVIAAVGVYRYFYTQSPKYAFGEIKKAIEEHDRDRFHWFC